MQTTLSQTWREIRIDRQQVWEAIPAAPVEFFGRTVSPPDVLSSRDVVAQVEAARAVGARVLLVMIENCGGGGDRAATEVIRALRRFSDDGRHVVAHVRGLCGSSAALIALAADLLVVDPDAGFALHSALGSERARIAADAHQRATWLD